MKTLIVIYGAELKYAIEEDDFSELNDIDFSKLIVEEIVALQDLLEAFKFTTATHAELASIIEAKEYDKVAFVPYKFT